MDAGDMVCESFSQKAFNPYYARSLISFLINQKKNKNEGVGRSYYRVSGGENSNAPGEAEPFNFDSVHHESGEADIVVDHNNDGFSQEVSESADVAALKAYVLNRELEIPCTQVAESLLFTRSNFDEYKQRAELVEARVGEILENKAMVHEITTNARIQNQLIEEELFEKLPYQNAEKDIVEDVAKTSKALTEDEFRKDVKEAEVDKIKDDVLGKPQFTNYDDPNLAEMVPRENLDNKNVDNVEVYWDKSKLDEPSKSEILAYLEHAEKNFPDHNVDGIEIAVKQNNEKMLDISYYDNHNKFGAICQERIPYEKIAREQSNKEKVFERIRNSQNRQAQQSRGNIGTISKDKTMPNVKLPK